MQQIVDENINTIIKALYNKIKDNGLDLSIDDIPAYNPKAQFIGGMVINLSCYVTVELIKDDDNLDSLRNIIRMASHMEMRTWGILNSLRGIYRLQKNDLLAKVVDQDTYKLLQKTLDWRTFVDKTNHYALINKPTNYYGVAFGIARYRELLGWESENHSIHLLNRFIEHISQYSGNLGYMDETTGEGRFDRYTIVTPGEVASLLMATGMDVPNNIREMLRKSCKIALQFANEEGHGFPYGRSSGAYGDTGILEVFSAAAELGGILSDDEMQLAYAYSVRIMKKIAEFWYDKDTEAMNLWDKGRKTDSYRNKNRILSETISICMHVIDSYEHWKKAGFEQCRMNENYSEMLSKLDKYTYVTFSDEKYKRGLAIVRDEKQIWTLPIVNGGKQYYYKDAYLPIPFQTGVIEYVPECRHGQLVPQLIMENGDVYMPLVYVTNITPSIENTRMTIVCEYSGLCYMGDNEPQKMDCIKATITYVFKENQIQREDTWIIEKNSFCMKEARLVFLSYSDEIYVNGATITFNKGIIKAINASGYETCELDKTVDDGNYNTSHGSLKNKIIWTNKNIVSKNELKFAWTITY